MVCKLINPRTHRDWLTPHSFGWYAQLGKLTGQYSLPWNSTAPEPDAEALFEEEVARMVENKKVIDIGCGHGEFTIRWSSVVKQIVGIDITSDFIETGRNNKLTNVSFMIADTGNGLPFESEEFDCAYNRKGPTSAYIDLKRVIKPGGRIISLHPGDHLSPELSQLFPNLFEPVPEGTPILNRIKDELERGTLLNQANIESVRSVSYLLKPIDVVRVCCFGQAPSVYEMVINESMHEIERIFFENATKEGLRVTGQAYIVRVTI